MNLLRAALALVAVSLIVVACASSGGAASNPPSEPPSSSFPPPASADPGGGNGSDPGLGEPEPGGAELVEPQPGQQNVIPVAIDRFDATASGMQITVDAHWTSGVAPCYVLDQVIVEINDDSSIDVTIREGTSDPDAICVMMAVSKHTIFTIDAPAAGTYTIRDSQANAAPVEVTVG